MPHFKEDRKLVIILRGSMMLNRVKVSWFWLRKWGLIRSLPAKDNC